MTPHHHSLVWGNAATLMELAIQSYLSSERPLPQGGPTVMPYLSTTVIGLRMDM